MYTQCPQCLTYFQVTPEHLRIAQGNVRCGQCRNVFSALGNLTEEPPKSAFQDNNAELEEEIFIDEEELEAYGEEFVEEYDDVTDEQYAENYNSEDFPEEYEEEFYITEEETGDEPPQQTPAADKPLDMEKTLIGSPPVSTQQANRHNLRPQVQSANINSKLSEAIATIERLKQSYSNLSIRKFEPNNNPSDASPLNAKKADVQAPPQRHIAPPPAAPAEQPELEEPPSHAEIFSPFIEKRIEKRDERPTPKPETRPSDVAIEHYTVDDGVDYEEALSALNDLKILEEEETASEEDLDDVFSQQVVLEEFPASPPTPPVPPPIEEALPVFKRDATGVNSPAVEKSPSGEKNKAPRPSKIKNPLKKQKADKKNKNEPVKIKSLDRKGVGRREPTAPKPSPTNRDSNAAESTKLTQVTSEDSAAKYLPAIPKQLMEDFHPAAIHGHPTWMNSLWALGSVLLMLAFLVQTVYFKHNDLARISLIRPWVESFCGYMSCTLGLPSDVKQLELVSQDIRSHPKVKNALLVTTTIINNARFAQGYPGLQITFTDLNGQRVAMRRFAPNEYLPADVIQADGMPPNTPIQVELEMMDPGSNAVNFEFDFIPLS